MYNWDNSIVRWNSIIYRYGQSYVGKKLESINIGGGQYIILLNLFYKEGISQEELSDRLKIDKGSVAKSLKKLEEEGYVERHTNSNDKRAYKVFLTQKGLDCIPDVKKAVKSWEDAIMSELSESEKQTLESLLHKMADKANNIKNDDGCGNLLGV